MDDVRTLQANSKRVPNPFMIRELAFALENKKHTRIIAIDTIRQLRQWRWYPRGWGPHNIPRQTIAALRRKNTARRT